MSCIRNSVDHVIGFTAPQLQVVRLVTFLHDYAIRVLIQGDNLPHFFGHKLRGSSELGMHTRVVHIERTHPVPNRGRKEDAYSTFEYFYTDIKLLPWGQTLDFSCPRCHCLRPFQAPKLLKGDTILFKCRAQATCKQTVAFTRPEGIEAKYKDSGNGVWYKRRLAVGDE